jgi:hypothetical protein
MPSSFLDKENGLYNPAARYAFTNITDEVFTSYWDKIPIVVQPRETIEVSAATPILGAGEAIALKMTSEMVNKIMNEEVSTDNLAHKGEPYYKSPKGMNSGIPAQRKVWEDQILRPLAPDEESPFIKAERKRLRAEIEAGIVDKPSTEPAGQTASMAEFADINNTIAETKTPTTETKKAVRTKAIK